MNICGKRSDGALLLNIGGGMAVILLGYRATKAMDLSVLDTKHGPWEPTDNSLASRMDARKKLEKSRVVELAVLATPLPMMPPPDEIGEDEELIGEPASETDDAIDLGDRSKYPDGKYPNEGGQSVREDGAQEEKKGFFAKVKDKLKAAGAKINEAAERSNHDAKFGKGDYDRVKAARAALNAMSPEQRARAAQNAQEDRESASERWKHDKALKAVRKARIEENVNRLTSK